MSHVFLRQAGLCVAIGVLASTALADAVGSELVARVVERAQAAGVSVESLAPALRAIERASDKNLPADAVADKVLEGLAKGVPPPRIVQAAVALEARLLDAGEVVQRAAPGLTGLARSLAVERVAAAAASAGGKDSLAILAGDLSGSDPALFVAAARVLGELADRGVPAAAARRAVTALAQSGYAPTQIGAVRALYDAYRAEGGTDPAPFLEELVRRAHARAPLSDMVNPFGDVGAPLQRDTPALGDGLDARPGERGERGQSALEQISGGRPVNPADGASRRKKR